MHRPFKIIQIYVNNKINILKAFSFLTMCFYVQDQKISIKSNPYTSDSYIINILNDSASLNNGYLLEGAVTATASLIMISSVAASF